MGRPQGSRNALIRITYDDNCELAGVLGNTATKDAIAASTIRWTSIRCRNGLYRRRSDKGNY
jgi:hypothetical protein